jgi:hypothetical protein
MAVLVANVLLVILCCMHVWWYYLFTRILKKQLSGTSAHEIGEEVRCSLARCSAASRPHRTAPQEYEGMSDDEADSPKRPEVQKSLVY